MENVGRTGEYNSWNQHLGDETKSLRTIDDIQDFNDTDESSLHNIEYFDRIDSSGDNVGSQGLNRTSLQINTNNLHGLNEIIRRQIELRELDKSFIFSGNNISVPAFSCECKFAEEGVASHLRPLCVKLLRIKIQGEAELYIKNL